MEENNKIEGLEKFMEDQKQEKRFLRELIDKHVHNNNKLLVTRLNMGKTQFGSAARAIESYTGKMKIDEIADRVLLGSDMSFMKNKIDEATKKVKIDEENINLILQRVPTWDRRRALAGYLISNNFRKFTTILVVVTPRWVELPHHENWGADGRALKDAIEFEALDSKGDIGLIDITGQDVFALDGQHRVMGLKGLKELATTHKFDEKDKSGKSKRESTLDEWMEEYDIDDIAEITQILDESISLEFVPAVLTGETREEATERLRNIFFNINTNAKKIDTNEQTIMDEQNGFSIIARNVASSHNLFKPSPSSKEKVKYKGNSLTDSDQNIVTLQAIKEGALKYFTSKEEEKVNKWNPKNQKHSPKKPDKDDLQYVENQFSELLDRISELPVYQSIDRGDSPKELRLSPSEKFDDETNERLKGHLFLKKIGFPILTEAVGSVLSETDMDLNDIFNRLKKLDSDGKFSIHNPQNLWYGVTYDMFSRRIITRNNNLAVELLKFLINGSDTNHRLDLLERVKQLRVIDHNKGIWRDFNGDQAQLSESPDLPF